MNTEDKDTRELNKKVFKKLGWIYSIFVDHPAGIFKWYPPNEFDFDKGFKELPPISSTWEDCAKYLVPFMRGKGFNWGTEYGAPMGGGPYDGQQLHEFYWHHTGKFVTVFIENDNIAFAACKAFMEVEL